MLEQLVIPTVHKYMGRYVTTEVGDESYLLIIL